jgi:transcriptional regulator with PAS, ATPase and Fis domain
LKLAECVLSTFQFNSHLAVWVKIMPNQPDICIVSPSIELSEKAERLISRYRDKANISILNTSLRNIDETIPILEKKKPDVVVSRGGLTWALKNRVEMPLVDISTSGYDIIDTLSPYLRRDLMIGVVGFKSVISGCKKIADMLGIKVKEFIISEVDVRSINNVEEDFRRYMYSNSLDVVISDTIFPAYFEENMQRFIPFNTGLDSVERALDEAVQLCEVLFHERIEQRQLNLILDKVDKTVVTISPEGKILYCNEQSQRVYNLRRHAALTQFFPNLQIDWERLKSGESVENELLISASGELVVNQYPIAEDDRLSRVLVTFQTASSLKGTEQKIRLKEAERKGFYAKYTFDDFVTRDAEMKTRLLLAQTYAATEATILVLGENGTGKEIVAQSIHNASPRRHEPFVAVNCGAIPAPILESELFGYVDGAFSGASRKGKAGLFELAHNGTLFLDEISELDKYLQTKLLRVLQERQLMRLGSDHVVPINIRVIAATNRDIPRLIDSGDFREDLYYRLNVLKITVLPLRDRPGDVRKIGAVRLAELRNQYNMPPLEFSDELWGLLNEYSWPGNVRQLNNIMERLALSFKEGVISPQDATLFIEDLTFREPENMRHGHETGGDAESQCTESDCASCGLLDGSYKEIRNRIVKAVVIKQKNNKSSAARQLNVDRNSLNRWLDD